VKSILAAALAALAVCVAVPSVAAAKSCSAGYTHAVIGGAEVLAQGRTLRGARPDAVQALWLRLRGRERHLSLEPKASTAAASGFAALNGKRLAGTSSSTWLPIASPFKHPTNIDGTITPPVETNDLTHTVSFFEFKSASAASAFYANPPLAARLITFGIHQYRPLSGATGVQSTSRGLDLRQCLWAGGPGQGGVAGKGTPSGGTMNSAGKCTKGTPSSFGVAILVRVGNVVVISQWTGMSVIGRSAGSAELSNAAPYARSALTLLRQVGLG
jgi:hypothetical protein